MDEVDVLEAGGVGEDGVAGLAGRVGREREPNIRFKKFIVHCPPVRAAFGAMAGFIYR